MAPSSEAEDHLRTIRSLMERATIYRSISVQAALIGGVLACLAGGVFAGFRDPFVAAFSKSGHAANADLLGFQVKWLVVLLLSGASNFFFLFRDAQRRAEPFISAGMRTALRSMIPALFCGAVFTSLCSTISLPQFWMLFYGLALLSTAHFAPGSLVRLGWAFLLTALVFLLIDGKLLLGLARPSGIPQGGPQPVVAWSYPDALMASTFGLYHLVYAACTFRRSTQPPLPAN